MTSGRCTCLWVLYQHVAVTSTGIVSLTCAFVAISERLTETAPLSAHHPDLLYFKQEASGSTAKKEALSLLRITHKELSLSLLKLTSDTSTCFIIVFKSNKYQYERQQTYEPCSEDTDIIRCTVHKFVVVHIDIYLI